MEKIKEKLSTILSDKCKLYLSGLVSLLFVFGIILSFYCNSATQLNDGWLEIYSDLLSNGGLLYKDCNFPLLPFPIFLFKFINLVFGETMLIGHIAGALLKLLELSLFYTILFRFFGARNAFWGTIVSGVVLVAVIFDCCIFSYNDIMYVLGLGTILLLLDFNEKISEGKKVKIQSLLIGFILGTMLISKQTHGVVITVATLVLQFMSVFKYSNLKQAFKYFVITIIPIVAVISSLFLYLFKTNTLSDFYINVIGGVSSKGNINSLIVHHFKVLADSSLIWVLYLGICVFIAIMSATKNSDSGFQIHKNKYDIIPTICLSGAVALIITFLAYYSVELIGLKTFDMKLFMQIDKLFKQICAIGFVFTDIFVFYLFFDYIFSKNYSKIRFSFLIFLGMIFAMNYSSMLSNSLTNLAFLSIGIATSWALQQETPLYRLKNGLIYIFCSTVLFLGVCSKLICPINWHCWIAGSVVGEKTKVDNIPFLRGMNLPKQEAEMFSTIRQISEKYTTKNDRIYCFLNNQLFYKVLDRLPLTKNANLYFDLCSDEKALSDMQILIKNPPKMIILLQWPYSMILLHEYLFRNSQKSGQREINNAISTMVANNKYKIVKIYKNKYSGFSNNYENFVTDKKDKQTISRVNKELKKEEKIFKKIKNPNYAQIYKHNKKTEDLQLEKALIFLKLKKELDIEHYRYFIPEGYELKVLIRTDIYNCSNRGASK